MLCGSSVVCIEINISPGCCICSLCFWGSGRTVRGQQDGGARRRSAALPAPLPHQANRRLTPAHRRWRRARLLHHGTAGCPACRRLRFWCQRVCAQRVLGKPRIAQAQRQGGTVRKRLAHCAACAPHQLRAGLAQESRGRAGEVRSHGRPSRAHLPVITTSESVGVTRGGKQMMFPLHMHSRKEL